MRIFNCEMPSKKEQKGEKSICWVLIMPPPDMNRWFFHCVCERRYHSVQWPEQGLVVTEAVGKTSLTSVVKVLYLCALASIQMHVETKGHLRCHLSGAMHLDF